MAFLESAAGGWVGGLVVGLGAAVVAPSIFSAAGSILRPTAKTIIKTGLTLADGVKAVVAEASEQVTDLVAEVRAESDPKHHHPRAERRPAAAHVPSPH
jgi:hypothetical protein